LGHRCSPRPAFTTNFWSLKTSKRLQRGFNPAPQALRKLGLAGVGFAVPRGTPYSVREWCRFLTKLSRLLSKTDCFQPVSFGTPCNRQFRCRGVSIINFACVMTDSSLLKTRKRLQRGFNSACLWDLCVAIVFAS